MERSETKYETEWAYRNGNWLDHTQMNTETQRLPYPSVSQCQPVLYYNALNNATVQVNAHSASHLYYDYTASDWSTSPTFLIDLPIYTMRSFESIDADWISDQTGGSEYLKSFFIKKTRDIHTVFDKKYNTIADTSSITTVTDYEYWQAKEDGTPVGGGWELLHRTNPNSPLVFDPSWQPYRTTSHIVGQPDAYTQQETFYTYDLIHTKIGTTDLGDFITSGSSIMTADAPYELKYHWYHAIRNAPYEIRTTTKATGQPLVRNSTYIKYKAVETTPAPYNEQVGNVVNTPCPPPPPVPPCPPPGYRCEPVINQGKSGLFGTNNINDPILDDPSIVYVLCTDDVQGAIVYRCVCEACPVAYESLDLNPVQRAAPHTPNAPQTIIQLPKVVPVATRMQLDNTDYATNYTAGSTAAEDITQFGINGNTTVNINGNLLGLWSLEYSYPHRTVLVDSTLSFNQFFEPNQTVNAKGIITKYNYVEQLGLAYQACVTRRDGSTTTAGLHRVFYRNLALPESVTVGEGRPDALTTHFAYNRRNQVVETHDPNGIKTAYSYDYYGRLFRSYRNDSLIAENGYSQWDNDLAKTFVQRGDLNFIASRNYLSDAKYIDSRAYSDPLGRTTATTTVSSQDLTKMIVAGLQTRDNYDRTTHICQWHYGKNAGNNSLWHEWRSRHLAVYPAPWNANRSSFAVFYRRIRCIAAWSGLANRYLRPCAQRWAYGA
jgi:YD repeat-containing protein